MIETTKIAAYPTHRIDFTLKDKKEIKSLIIEKAIKDAEYQANIIALANNKKLKNCIKTSFEPFDNAYFFLLARNMIVP